MSQMIRVTLPDGSAREVVRGTTPAQIAADIGPGLAKAALAAKIDGELRDIMRPLEEDTNLSLVTSRDEADAIELVRHDYAHEIGRAHVCTTVTKEHLVCTLLLEKKKQT